MKLYPKVFKDYLNRCICRDFSVNFLVFRRLHETSYSSRCSLVCKQSKKNIRYCYFNGLMISVTFVCWRLIVVLIPSGFNESVSFRVSVS